MAAATFGIAIVLTLAGCGVGDPQAGTPSAAVDPAVERDPEGTADDNLAFFDDVNDRFLSADPSPGGRPIVDNLVAAGFDRDAMELTRDTTPTGRQADSVQFSVRIGDACLIGQASESGYVGIVGPLLSGSRCLIGELRPIDW